MSISNIIVVVISSLFVTIITMFFILPNLESIKSLAKYPIAPIVWTIMISIVVLIFQNSGNKSINNLYLEKIPEGYTRRS